MSPFSQPLPLANAAQHSSGKEYRTKNSCSWTASGYSFSDRSNARSEERNGAVPKHEPCRAKAAYLLCSLVLARLCNGKQKIWIGRHIYPMRSTRDIGP